MDRSKQPQVLHMVGHGHIDPVWLWRLSEGLSEIRATFRSALDRMKEYPDFRFTASSAFFYAWVEQTDPEMFEEIRERVREGRWELAGGWWIEPDLNCPGGESLVRQGLYGQRYFKSRFGKFARVGFNPDSFGHPGTLPQILKKQRLEYYAYLRPSVDAIGRPVERQYPGGTTFRWISPDGSEVITTNMLLQYESSTAHPVSLDQLPGHPALNPGQVNVLGFYGVGNHGGGPTRANIDSIHRFTETNGNARAQLAMLESYFEARCEEPDASNLPLVNEELQYHARGCYGTHSRIKKLTRYCEHELLAAERLATLDSAINGSEYPASLLEQTWKLLLFNQFHDILAGTSVESACEEACEELGQCRVAAREIMQTAAQRIARNVDTTEPGTTLFALNPLPWPVQTVLAVPAHELRRLRRLQEETGEPAAIGVVDAEGRPVPVQPCYGEYAGGDQLAFSAELPSLGYACFNVVENVETSPSDRRLSASDTVLENDWWRIEFDAATGQMISLQDKSHGLEILQQGNLFTVLRDESDTWGHTVTAFTEEIGEFTATRVAMHECGDVYASIRIDLTYDRSTIRQHYRLYRDSPHIDCDIEIDWHGAFQVLKLGFETRVERPRATYEVPYGTCERPPSGDEEPGQTWFDCSGTIDGAPYGLGIANDAKYGYDIRDGRIRITLLRCPPYSLHDPERHDENGSVSIMDQGVQRLKLRLMPHAGGWATANLSRAGSELINELVLHMEYAHEGVLAQRKSFGSVNLESVDCTVLKHAEDGTGLTVRLVERVGKLSQGRLKIYGVDEPIEFIIGAWEVKTLAVDTATGAASEVDLLELDPSDATGTALK